MTSVPTDDFRLPLDVKPKHYDLTIKTDLNKDVFEGVVKVHLEVRNQTSAIVLNVADLEISDVVLHSYALKSEQSDTARSFDARSERGIFCFPNVLPAASEATLSIKFTGKLAGSMMGYYKSSFQHDGSTKSYALTQFEPTAARRAFPCWDEPLLKATFAITMISRAGTINLSNMPAISEEMYTAGVTDTEDKALSALLSKLSFHNEDQDKGEWKITRFMTTPPMSPYIVAFANGKFSYLEGSYKSPLSGSVRPLRVYSTPDVIKQTQYALEVKAKVIPYYERIFDIEYPLPKLDTLVAHDFDAGAMENWGLITGRTSAFLLDPDRVDVATKKRVTVFQSHEVAHMWFGNITTMEWWDYLYLNEGFATLVCEACNQIYPEWKVDSEFISENLNEALELDAKLSSHPIEVHCPDANQINQIFDSLSYAKAASVLRMLSNHVGQERFLKGVSIYLKKHLYANTVTKDLWEGISESTGINVSQLMDNWITKTGFPILSVTETKDGIHVRQDRFLETGPAEEKDNQTIWFGKQKVDNLVLDTRESSFSINTEGHFKLNAGTFGVYRVHYLDERLYRIAREAAEGDNVFSLNDRIGLVHDAMALAKSGYASVSSALTVVEIFKGEKEFLVWDSISMNLHLLVSTWWEHEDVTLGLNKFRRDLFVPLVKRLGYEYSSSDSIDISHVIVELQRRFKRYMESRDRAMIPADLFRISIITAVKEGGRKEYEFAKALYENPTTPPSESISAMYAMCASQDASCVKDTFPYILNGVRKQDVIYFLLGLQRNHQTRRSSASFVMNNFSELEKRFEGNFSFKDVISDTFCNLNTQADYKRLEEFFQQTMDTLRASIAWINRSTTDIVGWLAKRGV
ncbi:hypothetical protein F5J12DRAFT_804695 [Pisolithus orientalis]|uniref:uncharacterized protein n=1 Tax=Pisolithus orientalis TaxID=936130 RepID=UPI002224A267|nr:uncharacterized protein F5J12DRAFT_804695 [Pisolithus orientalis]KAI6028342.1 hypothetical protein F5J12DRAFT_804695 [Pisolithus orientalis]